MKKTYSSKSVISLTFYNLYGFLIESEGVQSLNLMLFSFFHFSVIRFQFGGRIIICTLLSHYSPRDSPITSAIRDSGDAVSRWRQSGLSIYLPMCQPYVSSAVILAICPTLGRIIV